MSTNRCAPSIQMPTTAEELLGVINNNYTNINQINVRISMLEKSLEDINKSKALFNKAINDMNSIENDVRLVFKGAAADSFMNLLWQYKAFCSARVMHMEALYVNYSVQIASLNEQKERSRRLIESIHTILSRVSNVR